MDDIRVARPHSYRPIAPRRPMLPPPVPQAYNRPVPEQSDETQTVSISIGLPQISLKGRKRKLILIVVAMVAIFLIGYAAGRYSIEHRSLPVASIPSTTCRHEA